MEGGCDMSTLNEHVIQNAASIMSRVPRPWLSLWMEELERGNVEVIIALFVGRLQEREHLDIGFGLLRHAVFLLAMPRHLNFHRSGKYLYNELRRVALGIDALQSSEC
jgi:hypothetical protein